jgi:hypothetical protein
MKFGARFPESILSCQHSKKYQKTQKESSWDSNKCSKQQKTEYVNKNSSILAIFFPLKHVKNFFDEILYIEDENLQLQ